MYESTRARPLRAAVPSMNSAATAPQPDRAGHLNAQLAGHLAALLTVTEELRAGSAPLDPELDEAAGQIANRIAELSPQGAPALIWEGTQSRAEEAGRD